MRASVCREDRSTNGIALANRDYVWKLSLGGGFMNNTTLGVLEVALATLIGGVVYVGTLRPVAGLLPRV